MRLSAMVAVLGGLTVVLWACPVRLGVVVGQWMAPTLKSGQLVLIDRMYYQSQPVVRGDVVALKMDGGVVVKRVSAVTEPRRGQGHSASPPPGSVFVMGDARLISWDSRQFGAVPAESILGRVIGFGIGPGPTAHVAKANGSDG